MLQARLNRDEGHPRHGAPAARAPGWWRALVVIVVIAVLGALVGIAVTSAQTFADPVAGGTPADCATATSPTASAVTISWDGGPAVAVTVVAPGIAVYPGPIRSLSGAPFSLEGTNPTMTPAFLGRIQNLLCLIGTTRDGATLLHALGAARPLPAGADSQHWGTSQSTFTNSDDTTSPINVVIGIADDPTGQADTYLSPSDSRNGNGSASVVRVLAQGGTTVPDDGSGHIYITPDTTLFHELTHAARAAIGAATDTTITYTRTDPQDNSTSTTQADLEELRTFGGTEGLMAANDYTDGANGQPIINADPGIVSAINTALTAAHAPGVTAEQTTVLLAQASLRSTLEGINEVNYVAQRGLVPRPDYYVLQRRVPDDTEATYEPTSLDQTYTTQDLTNPADSSNLQAVVESYTPAECDEGEYESLVPDTVADPNDSPVFCLPTASTATTASLQVNTAYQASLTAKQTPACAIAPGPVFVDDSALNTAGQAAVTAAMNDWNDSGVPFTFSTTARYTGQAAGVVFSQGSASGPTFSTSGSCTTQSTIALNLTDGSGIALSAPASELAVVQALGQLMGDFGGSGSTCGSALDITQAQLSAGTCTGVAPTFWDGSSIAGAYGTPLGYNLVSLSNTVNSTYYCAGLWGGAIERTSPGAGLQTKSCTQAGDLLWNYNGGDQSLSVFDTTGSALGGDTSQCATTTGGGGSSNVVQAQSCVDGSTAQDWIQEPDGSYLNPASGNCLNVQGGGGTAENIITYACNGDANEYFALQAPLSAGSILYTQTGTYTGQLFPKGTALALSVPASGSNVALGNGGSKATTWTWQPLATAGSLSGGSTSGLLYESTNQCLTLLSSSAQASVSTCDFTGNTTSQLFNLVRNSNGTWSLQAGGACLDVWSNHNTIGASVGGYGCSTNSSLNQQWLAIPPPADLDPTTPAGKLAALLAGGSVAINSAVGTASNGLGLASNAQAPVVWTPPSDHNNPTESWSLVPNGDPLSGELVNWADGLCLTATTSWVGSWATSESTCNYSGSTAGQVWTAKVNGDGSTTWITSLGDYCLDDQNSGGQGTAVLAYTCNSGTNQKWNETAIKGDQAAPSTESSTASYWDQLSASLGGTDLVLSPHASPGANVALDATNAVGNIQPVSTLTTTGPPQRWSFKAFLHWNQGEVSNVANGGCLTNAGNGQSVTTSTCDANGTTPSQIWTVTPGVSGGDKLQSLVGSQCLDDQNWGTSAATPVLAYACNGGSNQYWSLTSLAANDTPPPPSAPASTTSGGDSDEDVNPETIAAGVLAGLGLAGIGGGAAYSASGGAAAGGTTAVAGAGEGLAGELSPLLERWDFNPELSDILEDLQNLEHPHSN